MSWKEKLNRRILSDNSPDEIGQQCLSLAQEISANIEETFEIVNYGLALDGLSLVTKAKLVAHKATLYNRSGGVDKGLHLCNDFLNTFPDVRQCPKEYVHIEQLRILFLTQLARSQEAVELGEKTFVFVENQNDKELFGESCDLWRLTGAIAASMGDIEKGIAYIEKAKQINEKYADSEMELPIIYGSLGIYIEIAKITKTQVLITTEELSFCRKLNNHFYYQSF